jgi:hypothetical protein
MSNSDYDGELGASQAGSISVAEVFWELVSLLEQYSLRGTPMRTGAAPRPHCVSSKGLELTQPSANARNVGLPLVALLVAGAVC